MAEPVPVRSFARRLNRSHLELVCSINKLFFGNELQVNELSPVFKNVFLYLTTVLKKLF